ncbi:dTDP-4-dehydrorhamnose reductase [Chelativorans sp. AA-79]|uniref:dTDP-4-dehydrorhamnose reductase n=1 Tax=Chelativorans sp. AA-79 TaxID=3028735 RepID=UPI0023F75B31|nr:dTDP-4-dehydrorhamnose reductase [Chelativorans sp. AA-79]WEX11800.1 dTDP-4-dehydrorhamnose reductase [Chelativorans sp. AA-79]
MKVLVTGKHGQLVQSLLDRAAAHPGLTLLAVGRPELDLADPRTIEPALARHAPDLVVNAAAYTAVDQAEDEPAVAHAVNAEAPGLLARAAVARGLPLVQISTDYVFDGALGRPYREDDAVNPLSVYGASKLAGEEAVRRENPDHLILRTAWVYSPYGRNFLKTMLKLAETRSEVHVVSDQTGNPTSALDIADGLLAAIEARRGGTAAGWGTTYHLAGTGAAGWHDFAAHIFEESRRRGGPHARVVPIATADFPTKAARPPNSRLACDRFAEAFGFAMPDWREAIAAVVGAFTDAS